MGDPLTLGKDFSAVIILDFQELQSLYIIFWH
jgi:hypothetical protein